MEIVRLSPGDARVAHALFAMMADAFEEECVALSDGYVERLLGSPAFWAIAAVAGDAVVGGLTAHALPMTRSEATELFIYDLAVRADHRRRGVGRQVVTFLLAAGRAAGIDVAFVPADDEDTHALDFYRAIGGAPAPVTLFTFQG